MLNHIDAHMKSFIKTEECRRKTLLSHFESVSLYPEQPTFAVTIVPLFEITPSYFSHVKKLLNTCNREK